MSPTFIRRSILVLGLFTAIVHLIVLPIVWGQIDMLFVLWVLNGVGYLVLLWALFTDPPFLQGTRPLLHYAFMAYTFVTILAWFALGSMTDRLAWVTKADEVLLIAALFIDLRREQAA